MSWSGMGVGGVVAELKSGRGGGVADLMWGEGGKDLSVLGGREGMEVETWDIGTRRVVGKWRDERAFGGKVMKASGDGSYIAVGWVHPLNILGSWLMKGKGHQRG